MVRRSLALLVLTGCAAAKPAQPERPGQVDYATQKAELDERIAGDLRIACATPAGRS